VLNHASANLWLRCSGVSPSNVAGSKPKVLPSCIACATSGLLANTAAPFTEPTPVAPDIVSPAGGCVSVPAGGCVSVPAGGCVVSTAGAPVSVGPTGN